MNNQFQQLNSIQLSGSVTHLGPLRKFYNKYYIVGTLETNFPYDDVFLIELDSLSDQDPYIFKFGLGSQPSTFAFDITPYNQRGYLLSFFGYPNQSPFVDNEFVLMDSGFINDRDYIIEEKIHSNSQFYRAGENLFFTGRHIVVDTINQEISENIAIAKLDTLTDSTMQVKFTHFGKEDTSDIEAFNNLSGNSAHLYVGGASFYDNRYSSQDGDFVVAKYDFQLNQEWEKYIGLKNAYDVLWMVKATSDGGCLLAGTTYDYINKTEPDRDLLFYKLNAKGEVVSTQPSHSRQEVSIQIYPNPATNKIVVDGPQDFNGTLYLINAMGQQIERWTINGRSVLSVDQIPTGIYFYRFHSKNEKYYVGQVSIAR